MASVPVTKVPDGMIHWTHLPPPYHADKIEVWREGWAETRVISRQGDPAMNVFGLYWRAVPESKPTPAKPRALRVVK